MNVYECNGKNIFITRKMECYYYYCYYNIACSQKGFSAGHYKSYTYVHTNNIYIYIRPQTYKYKLKLYDC